MTGIPDYQLADDVTLGYIAWATITDVKVTHTEVTKLMQDLGLTAPAPNAPRKGDAFKRACRYSERKGVAIPGTEYYANFLVRSVAQTSTEVERHLVMEVVDADNRRLDFQVCAELRFDRVKEQLHVKTKKIDPEKDKLILTVLTNLASEFDDAQSYLDPQVLRLIVRNQLADMRAVNVRPYGSVYFYPIKFKAMGEALAEFTRALGGGCNFHSIPLVNQAAQRQMVKAAFETEIHEDAAKLVDKLKETVTTGKKMSAREYAECRARHSVLMENVKTYRELVEDELTQAEVEMDLLNHHVKKVVDAEMVE